MLGCTVVRIFRADMLECCQQRHLPFARLQTSRRQGRKPPPVPPRQAAGRGCATRSASGLSGLSCRRSCRIRRSASRQRQAPDSGKQFVIDRGNGDDGAYGRFRDGLPDKLGLAHFKVRQTLGEVGVFFLGHAGLDYMAAVGRVVSLGYGYQLLSLIIFLRAFLQGCFRWDFEKSEKIF